MKSILEHKLRILKIVILKTKEKTVNPAKTCARKMLPAPNCRRKFIKSLPPEKGKENM